MERRTIPGPSDAARPAGWAGNPPWSEVWAYYRRAYWPRLGYHARITVRTLAERACAELPACPTTADWSLWFAERFAHCAASTRNLYRRLLQSVYERAREAGGPASNPLAGHALRAERVRVAYPHPVGRSPAEVAASWARVRAVLDGRPAELAMVAMLRYCGLRPGEVRGLLVSSFAVGGNGSWWVTVDAQRGGGRSERRPLKTVETARRIELDAACWACVRPWWRSRRRAGGDGALLWTVEVGQKRMARLREALTAVVPGLASVPNPWHAWRHAFGVEVVPLVGGVASQGLMGHGDVRTTLLYSESHALRTVSLPSVVTRARRDALAVVEVTRPGVTVSRKPAPNPQKNPKKGRIL